MECATSGILPVTRHRQNAIEDFLNRVLKLNRGIMTALLNNKNISGYFHASSLLAYLSTGIKL